MPDGDLTPEDLETPKKADPIKVPKPEKPKKEKKQKPEKVKKEKPETSAETEE